ncbi:spiroplasma phage ORF1-like family protein [Spiroplasma endosymbiont of Seladonia tumulorum]|uniref:spiroplasma phage ORF1-like family protein n=1 Tax=Spiroplasma endosymbiont of Seladonia tumulorum TaxID=3066321 RepID=UPI0030D25D9B
MKTGGNKPEPKPEKPQEPPVEGNWKLITDYNSFVFNIDNKFYFFVFQPFNSKQWKILKFKHDTDYAKEINGIPFIPSDIKVYVEMGKLKGLYCWDRVGEPQKPTINLNTGEITDWNIDNQNKVKDFLNRYLDVIFQENIRVQQGGNPDYNSPVVGTQRIIFDFEIVDNMEKSVKGNILTKKSIYRMILTIDKNNNIIAGSLELFHNWKYADEPVKNQKDKLGFLFTFIKDKDNIFNFDGNTNSYLENGNIKYYEQMKGQIDINKFLKAFFAYALVPVFQNRSNFIESGYIDNLQYDTVLINFFGLKLVNFRDVLIDEKNTNKNQFEKLLNSMFTVSQNFYKDYLRTIFDLENNTYTQGYNKKYGLLANNGFKIYPRYFYFSDKYKSLDFKMYSAYKNRFYNTNYGDVFNYDFSVANNYNINQNEGYVFEGILKNKYGLKYKKMEEQKIGYNVFELQAQKENDMYRYYDFNFGIYNWQEINNGGLFPDSQWWQAQYESCSWYNLACHIRNAAIWIVNNIPGIKQVNELANGVGKIFQTIYSFFSQTFEVWKFSPALYSTITNLFLLIIFMKFVRLI